MRLVYLHLPRFPLQHLVAGRPELAHRPVALVELSRGVRRLCFVSGSAARSGLRPGMTEAASCARVPSLERVLHEPEEARRALLGLAEASMAVSPAFQIDPPEGLWLDACAAHLFGGEAGLLARVRSLLEGLGYLASGVVADRPFTARAVARYGRAQAEVVAPGADPAALAPLPLEALEGLSAPPIAALEALGLRTLGELAALPAESVSSRWGRPGIAGQRLARGQDDSRLVPDASPECWEERFELPVAAESAQPLLFGLKVALERLAARLAGRGRAALRLRLELELDTAAGVEGTVREASATTALSLSLARPSNAAGHLLALFRHRLEGLSLPAAVERFTVVAEEVCVARGQQLALGGRPDRDASLDAVLSRLTTALGEGAACGLERVETHRPEGAFRQVPFRPPEREGLGLRVASSDETEATWPERPTLLLERPRAVEVTRDGEGRWRTVRIDGEPREVAAVVGPERLSGGWWEPVPFARDYYRVFLSGVGEAWLFQSGGDGRFYLHGLFD